MTTPVKDYTEVDRTLGPVLNEHAKEAAAFIALESRIKAAEGDRAAALKAYITSSDDTDVKKLRGVIEQAQAKLHALAEKNVVSEKLSDEDKQKLVTELDTVKSNFRDGRKAILSIAETMKAIVNMEAVNTALEEIGDPTKSGRGRKVGSTGSNLPKASAVLTLTSSENGKDSWTFQTFGEAAKHLNLGKDGVEVLQKEFAKAAGVQHNEIASVDKPQSFTVGPFAPSKAIWTVKTQPKQRKRPGPRPNQQASTKTA